ALSLINTAKAFNKKVIGFITDMNQPLGNYIGNWLEIVETIEVLQGKYVPDLCEVTFNLSGAMLMIGGKAGSIEEGVQISKDMAASGKGFDTFLKMVKLQGGDISVLKNPASYAKAKIHHEVFADKEGYLTAINNYEVGMAALELGAGRLKKDDIIDPKAGIIFYPKLGDKIIAGTKIADVYTDSKQKLTTSLNRLQASVTLSEKKTAKPKLIREIIQ
ncbi:MAG: thymidine phosphorylase, partial [Ignavibacteriales bacterium]|nr:thymidine phosphorylase [Ignavibacteriales bacterium]